MQPKRQQQGKALDTANGGSLSRKEDCLFALAQKRPLCMCTHTHHILVNSVTTKPVGEQFHRKGSVCGVTRSPCSGTASRLSCACSQCAESSSPELCSAPAPRKTPGDEKVTGTVTSCDANRCANSRTHLFLSVQPLCFGGGGGRARTNGLAEQ